MGVTRMIRKILYGSLAFALAFVILSVSILQTSSLIFAFSSPKPSPTPSSPAASEILYQLPYPGKIMPGSILWPVKAIRDKVWYLFAFSHLEKAKMALLFSDKRLVAGDQLVDSGNTTLGVSVIDKAEKYLEVAATEEKAAREGGSDTSQFLTSLATSSLKHQEVIDDCMKSGIPQEAKEQLSISWEYSKGIYRDSSETLLAKGKEPPKSPFDGH